MEGWPEWTGKVNEMLGWVAGIGVGAGRGYGGWEGFWVIFFYFFFKIMGGRMLQDGLFGYARGDADGLVIQDVVGWKGFM